MKQYSRKILSISIIFLLSFTGIIQGASFSSEKYSEVSSVSSDRFDWWPMFQHDSLNTGFSHSTAPDSNQIAWEFQANATVHSPAVSNGYVYVGSDSLKDNYLSESFFYCLDLTGSIIWKYETRGNLQSTPAVVNDSVFITSDNGDVYCFHSIEGNLKWKQRIGQGISSPVVVDGIVVVQSLDGNVYGLAAETGEVLWDTPLSIDVLSTPAVVGDKVFVHNHCLNLYTGNFEWTSDVGIALLSSPCFFEDKIYICSRDEKMYCLDADTGDKLWRFYTGSIRYENSLSTAYGNVYVGNAFGFIYCVNATTGEYVWSEKFSPRTVSTPVIADGKVFIGSVDTNLYCLNAFTGEYIWNFSTNHHFLEASAIADGHVFSASGDTLYCFGEPYQAQSDLFCTGSISYSNIEPNSVITSNFSVKNKGRDFSLLNWKVLSYPEWGKWSFSPKQGMNLSAADGSIVVEVSLIVPSIKESTFPGKIIVVNSENPDDFESIPVSITTDKRFRFTDLIKQFLNHIVFSFFNS